MSTSNLPDFSWLKTSQELKPVVKRWLSLPRLFLDTEFIRERTFYPELALIQVFDGERGYLIEPAAATKDSGFSDLLTLPTLRKVFHSASEDCEVLYRHFGVQMSGLWDTQIAAAYLGHGVSLGYGALIETCCGKSLEKGLSRSDWKQRPLTDEQIQYALDDVIYLSEAYEQQVVELEKRNIDSQWVLQDCDALCERVEELDDIESAYLDVKNAWKLNAAQLARLYLITIWREKLAREKNIPKTFIMRNDVVFALAQMGTKGKSQFPPLKGWHPASRRKYESSLVELLNDTSAVEQATEKHLVKPLSPGYWQKLTAKMQQAREKIDNIAEQLGIEPDILCSKKLMRQYVKFCLGEQPQPPRGWTPLREAYLADPVASVFR